MKLKDKVKNYREKYRLTIVEMAIRCGISPTTLLHIEKGYGTPNAKTIGKLKEVLEKNS